VKEIADHIGADSLAYISVKGMLSVVPAGKSQCAACFTGKYPTPIPEDFTKGQFDNVCGAIID
jgi:amidophosphoribosyltransferase